MDERAFGVLVASLRKELRNEFDEVLTQYDLAERANISVIALQKIEQGRSGKLAPETVLNLGKALQLPSRARLSLFQAAMMLDPDLMMKVPVTPKKQLDNLLELLGGVQTPAFVMDPFGDLLACNPALIDLYMLADKDADHPEILSRYNLMRLVYAPEYDVQRAMLEERLQPFLHRLMLIYKTITLAYRHHPFFTHVLPELNRYPLFREQWQSPFYEGDDVVNYNLPFKINHPKYGKMDFIVTVAQTMTKFGELSFVNYIPLDAVTMDQCLKINAENGNEVFPLAEWPKAVELHNPAG